MPVFELNLIDYLNFKRMQKRAPKLYSQAAAHVLNSAAFGTRKLALRELKAQSIVRNERFISGSMRVEKARRGAPMDMNRSIVGSIKRDNFSGWREQEGGQQTKRDYLAKPAARRGNMRKQIGRLARLRNTGRFPQPKDFRGRNTVSRAYKMIHILSRSGFTHPFLIFGLENTRKRMPPGLYRFGAGKYPNRKIKLLQRFKSPGSTKRNPWMAPAREKYIKYVNLRTVWGRAVERELKRFGIKI